MKQNTKNIILLVIKCLLGAVFCASAIMKLVSIDQFELYIFSFRFFNLHLSFLAARLVIAAELFLGIGFIMNIYNKVFMVFYLIMILGFSALLVYTISIGRSDNCHCFGEFIKFNPVQSLIKNGVFLILLLVVWKVPSFSFRGMMPTAFAAAIASVAVVFLVSPPDNYTDFFKAKAEDLNREKFAKILSDSTSLAPIAEGTKIVCFYSTECDFCAMASEKVANLQQFYDIPEESVFILFWGLSNAESVAHFYEKTLSPHYQYSIINVVTFLDVTNGMMPIILITKDGEVIHEFNYRNINQNIIRDCFPTSNR